MPKRKPGKGASFPTPQLATRPGSKNTAGRSARGKGKTKSWSGA